MERNEWSGDTIGDYLTDVEERSQGLHPEFGQLCANYGAIFFNKEFIQFRG